VEGDVGGLVELSVDLGEELFAAAAAEVGVVGLAVAGGERGRGAEGGGCREEGERGVPFMDFSNRKSGEGGRS
jgi:hypothetical protein